MIRLLLRLLKITDYEVCQSCATLKEQLSYERDEKKQLTETLLNILSPKVVESVPVELKPIGQSISSFGKKRAALEAADREKAHILRDSTNLGKPDDALKNIENLEQELGIEKEA